MDTHLVLAVGAGRVDAAGPLGSNPFLGRRLRFLDLIEHPTGRTHDVVASIKM